MRITLSPAQAVALSKALAPAIGTDPIRNHLMTVELTVSTDHAVLSATDGYRLHQVTINTDKPYEPGERMNLAGKELVSALAHMAKSIGKNPGVVVLTNTTENGEPILGVKVLSSTGSVVIVDVIDRDFPNCAAILDSEPATSELVCQFESEYLSDIVLAAGHIARMKKAKGMPTMAPVKILNLNPSKPCHVTATNSDLGMTFHGVIMPQRP